MFIGAKEVHLLFHDGSFLIYVWITVLSRQVQYNPIKRVITRNAERGKAEAGAALKTRGGEITLFKAAHSKRTAHHDPLCNHWALCLSLPTSCLPSDTLTFLLQSHFRYNPPRGKKSTFPARTSLCSFIPGDPASLLWQDCASVSITSFPLLTSPLFFSTSVACNITLESRSTEPGVLHL